MHVLTATTAHDHFGSPPRFSFNECRYRKVHNGDSRVPRHVAKPGTTLTRAHSTLATTLTRPATWSNVIAF
jgi:hypothetical protein